MGDNTARSTPRRCRRAPLPNNFRNPIWVDFEAGNFGFVEICTTRQAARACALMRVRARIREVTRLGIGFTARRFPLRTCVRLLTVIGGIVRISHGAFFALRLVTGLRGAAWWPPFFFANFTNKCSVKLYKKSVNV